MESGVGLKTAEALRLTERVNRISVSPTMAVLQEAEKYKAQGVDVVDFGPGEPDFPTPEHIKRAAIQALDENQHEIYGGCRDRCRCGRRFATGTRPIWVRLPRISRRSASSLRAASMRSSTRFARW